MSNDTGTIRPYVFIVAIIGLAIGGAAFFASNNQVQTNDDGLLRVAASTVVLTELVERIGVGHIQMVDIGEASVNTHDFEPSPRASAAVIESDLLVYHGGGVDSWAEDLASEVQVQGGQVLEIMSVFAADDLIAVQEEASSHEHDEEDGQAHSAGIVDPHIWLDPILLQHVAQAIGEALAFIDPTNVDEYTQRAQEVINDLNTLHRSYTEGLSSCGLNSIVVSHDAFEYMANRYNINTLPIAGFSPSAEPSIRRLAELTKLVEQEGITYIFFEELTSSKLASTLATETDTSILVLSPIEGFTTEQSAAGVTYFSMMRQNLQNLQMGLACQ
jgi:zinc transport system substrate-binding protein